MKTQNFTTFYLCFFLFLCLRSINLYFFPSLLSSNNFMKNLMLFIFIAIHVVVQSQTITPEIIADLRNVSEVAISPNGNDIAYVVRVPGEDVSGMQKGVLMIVPKTGGASKIILDKTYNPSSISWSNDGKNIYFIMRDSVKKTNQINMVQISNKEVIQITSGESIKKYAFSPNGKYLLLLYTDPKTEQEKVNEKNKKDWVVMDQNYKYDRLYITDATASIPPKKLFEKNLSVSEFIWSPDNTTIIFRGAEKPTVDYGMMYERIYRVNVTGGEPQIICETEGKLGSMDVSPDGKMLAFCGAVDISDPLPQSVFLVPVKGGEPKNLTEKLEASVTDIKWTSNSTLIAHAVEGCYSSLKKIDTKTGKHINAYSKGVIIRAMSLHIKTGAMAFSASTPQHPYEVFSGTITGGLKKLTDHNSELNKIKLSKQEVISWTAPDGWKIEGILTYPINYRAGTKYPLLLQIHGGPEGVSTNGWNTRAVYPVQWYAAHGYFVLEPNYRGSQGRGVDFAKGNHNDLGGKEFDDILAGIDYLVNKGMVDKDKIGTGGFSYGGYLSAWAATKHSARFKVAVMGAGISNWISFSGTTEIIHENSLVHWNLWWYDNMDLVWERSPLAHINNAKTPVMIVHGNADTRVPLSQSEEMYNALKLKKVHTQLIVYQRQPHGLLEREAQIDYMNRTLDWFNDYLK
jgi:dipeptidyl aminopeptidase/acylaminoacyl peptidase